MADIEPKPTTVHEDLEQHPELTPLLHEELGGRITCIGWISPIYSWPVGKDAEDVLYDS